MLEFFSKIVKKKVNIFFSADFNEKKCRYVSDDFKKKKILPDFFFFLNARKIFEKNLVEIFFYYGRGAAPLRTPRQGCAPGPACV